KAREAVIDDQAVERAALEILALVLGEDLAGAGKRGRHFLEALGEDGGDRLVEEIEAAAELDDGAEHGWYRAGAGVLRLSPAARRAGGPPRVGRESAPAIRPAQKGYSLFLK